MTTKKLDQRSARDRLLDAADELFYEEGVHTVGIDRVIERAGVAKATLYNTFGSKDELIRAYLRRRHQQARDGITAMLERCESPRERVLVVFDALAAAVVAPGFRGCAFINASAESLSGSVAEEVSDESRAWLRSLLTDLATKAGASRPSDLAHQLVFLYDGAGVAARMDRDRGAPHRAREAAAALLDAQTRA